jgi:F-type H+-transporting ATPase subunit b
MLLQFEPGLVIWAIVTFFVLLLALYFTAWPKLLSFLENRENYIRSSLEDAEKARQAAERITAEYKDMILQAKKESVDILKQTRAQADKVREELLAKAREDAKRILDKTIREFELERDKAIIELKNRAVNLSVAIAGKIIMSSLTSEQQTDLAMQALKEMDSTQ